MSRPTVAVIGTGIAGMAAAYFLRKDYEVTFFEKNNRSGGHTNTVRVPEAGRWVDVDTGFMVYNEITYPNLVRFFNELSIPTQDTSMSFSVQSLENQLEYCGTGIAGLFAQKRNWVNLSFWALLSAIHRFNEKSPEVLTSHEYDHHTVAQYVEEKKWDDRLLRQYLLPMSAAIWSTPPDQMMNFPIVALVRFFKNHGLLGLKSHYQWKTIPGGSRQYRDKVMGFFKDHIHLDRPASKIYADGFGVKVRSRGIESAFDKVIVATHADEALALLERPSLNQKILLGSFKYQKNAAILHTDESVMPKTRATWSSWNARTEPDGRSSVVYWMNSLQKVSDQKNYFVSINDPGLVKQETILWSGNYEHPVFDLNAIRAQAKLHVLNQDGPVYFCGSYFKYGFHEDAFTSGLKVAEALLGKSPWK